MVPDARRGFPATSIVLRGSEVSFLRCRDVTIAPSGGKSLSLLTKVYIPRLGIYIPRAETYIPRLGIYVPRLGTNIYLGRYELFSRGVMIFISRG